MTRLDRESMAKVDTMGADAPHMPSPVSGLSIDPTACAFFFDFDGVIADIAPTPDAVHVPDERAGIIRRTRETAGNALALVSGREIDDIRSVYPAYEGAASGGHGAETDWPDGTRESREADPAAIEAVQQRLQALAGEREGFLFETKRLGGVLHFRADPSLEPVARREVEALIADHPGMELQPAKMAFEIKPEGFSKGSVIRAFMEREPFAGRTPLYVGDDVTDEAAFAVVNEMNGYSVKVGMEPTVARHRARTPDELFDWLGGLLRAG